MKTIKTHTHLSSLIQMNNVKRFCSNKNNRIKSFTLAVFIVFAISTTGQNLEECGTFIDTTEIYQPSRFFDYSSDTWLYKYRTPGFWIPNSTTPIKTVLVNWVICRDDNGGNGWQDSQTFRDEVDRMFENINHVYSTSLPKGYSLTCEPQYTHIYDSRIRFELNEIIFIDSTVFNQCGVGQMPMIFSIVDYVHNHYPSSSKALTHIFTQPYNPIYPNAWGQYDAYYNSYSFVITQGSMADPSSVVWPEHVAHITHEYGHAVGLDHTYNGERTCISHFDFLDDVFGNCSENVDHCEHQSQTCDGENVCYLPTTWFEGNTPPYPLMSGCMYSPRYISPKSMGRMHRALSLYDYRFICPNGAMHKYVKEKYSYIYPLTVSTDETWDFAIKMYQDIVVTNDAALTITGEVKMPIDGKIIVHPGAKLIIDGGRITSAHDLPWSGIEVWGNSSMHQYTVNGLCAQGYLELKNGAVIENAKCAVELWRPNHWSTTGGIIHAIDATFKNNAMAVHALCYNNYDPNTLKETNYRGFLKNCSFIIDEDYLGTETFLKHVKLGVVNGIRFLGCDFSADRSVNGVHPWCIGISAYNAGFSVDSYCAQALDPCPVNDLKKSTFTGLSSGICVDGDGSTSRIFTVNETVFTNNDTGIKATNISYPVVHNNEFCIGRGEYCDFTYGIHLKNVSSFTIEDNYFHPYSQSNATTVGIAIAESRGVNDVYRNTFENLSRANLAFGRNAINTNIGPLPGSILGLTYTCNEYTGNQRDIMVLKLDGVACVQLLQGSVAIPAGNTFTQSGFQIYNNGSYSIEYYYNSNETDETPNVSLLYQVNTHGTTSINPCHTHYGRGALLKSASEKTALESDYLSAYSTYLNLKQLYESLIDGGNTANQIADINTATPADMWQLRARLLDLSPYVSGQVLASAAERSDIFSDPVLFEILAANPDELKNDSLIAFLENKTNPLPDYMIELLRQIASGASSRTALVAQIAKYSHDYTLAAGDIVRSNLSDTMANPTELRNWLGNMNAIAADRMIISSYLHDGDSTSAFTLANMLPELYGLQGDDLNDHNDYIRLLNIFQGLISSQRTVYQMTDSEVATVRSITESGIGVSKSMAESLLAEVTDDNDNGCITITEPEGNGTDRGMTLSTSLNDALGFSVSVAPNPATTWTTIDYTLPAKVSKAILTITNAVGVNVLSKELEGVQNSKVLDLRGLAAGVYIYTIRCGQCVEKGKLVITK